MRVLISADMEGTCGVSSWVHVEAPEIAAVEQPTNAGEYERFRRQMTAEVNAAVEGAFAGGATAVIVNDSHDGQRNIYLEDLHRDAQYISGADKRFGMMQGIDQEIDAVMYTGYHAKAGTVGAPLAHTWNRWVQDVRINGKSTGEFGLNAAIAGAFGARVIMVAGDEKAIVQTKDFVGGSITSAVVKEGLSYTSAMHVHPDIALQRIGDAARNAMSESTSKPFAIETNATIEVDADHQARIDQMLLIPGTSRAGDRTIAFSVNNGIELNDMFRLVTKVGGISLRD